MADPDEELRARGPHFLGGPTRDVNRMIVAVAAIREAGLPGTAALAFSQLLLNLAGNSSRERAEQLIADFLDAAGVLKGGQHTAS